MVNCDFTIYLGPLLGIESDTLYSVCILVNSNDEVLPQDIILCLDNRSVKCVGHVLIRKSYWFIKFEFESRNDSKYRVLRNYYFTDRNYSKYINVNGAVFSFWEAPISEIPVVGFVSCNGSDRHYPIPKDSKLYSGWEHISNKLDSDYRMDYLFLTGDQVYADSIFDEIKQLNNLREKGTEISEDIKEQIDSFYFKLYIDSWKNSFVSKALASIPNAMVWDDHDIIDGFGSLENSHDNPVLKELFNVASKYYKIFQRRLWKCLDIESKDLLASSVIKIRNYLFVLPDTRSFRTPSQVMATWQYSNILNIASDQNIIDWVASVNRSYPYWCLCFIVPVPVAHINYTSFLERSVYLLEKIWKLEWAVRKALDDDMLDHWDHKNHQVEQIKLLNTVFALAEQLNPKNVMIVSGDVHSNGAATISKETESGTRKVSQLICSPIVNNPFSRKLLNVFIWLKLANRKERIPGYTLDLKNFGNAARVNISNRAFMYITSGGGFLKANLKVEENGNWNLCKTPRTINNFKTSR